jgi:predicted HD phosphohydrolase
MDHRKILDLYERQGLRASVPGGLSPLQHGWQCARLARNAGAAPSLQLAAWLHDLGHLVGAEAATGGGAADDGGAALPLQHRNPHARRGAALLLPLFGASVSGPVALHVEAKRCMATLRPDYRRALSSAALHQLALQGGAMPLHEARAFLQRPHAPAALRLRLWDDGARDPHLWPPSASAALDALARLMRLLTDGTRGQQPLVRRVGPAPGMPRERVGFRRPDAGAVARLPSAH